MKRNVAFCIEVQSFARNLQKEKKTVWSKSNCIICWMWFFPFVHVHNSNLITCDCELNLCVFNTENERKSWRSNRLRAARLQCGWSAWCDLFDWMRLKIRLNQHELKSIFVSFILWNCENKPNQRSSTSLGYLFSLTAIWMSKMIIFCFPSRNSKRNQKWNVHLAYNG